VLYFLTDLLYIILEPAGYPFVASPEFAQQNGAAPAATGKQLNCIF
jgi:hypothetical protein